MKIVFVFVVIGLSLLGSWLALAQNTPATPPMTFFLTSVGPGKGADLGGLAGADAHCQKLAGMPATAPGAPTSARRGQTR